MLASAPTAQTLNRFELWPRPSLPDRSLEPVDVAALEQFASALFANVHAVAFSSARAALSAVVSCMQIGRADFVELPPYSSHCVIESIARFATPLPYGARFSAPHGQVAQLLYHPHGFASPFDVHVMPNLVIDDAVDAFFEPGVSPIIEGRRFCVWSCAKVLGTYAGGFVFCRDQADYERLCDIRAAREATIGLQHARRLEGLTDSQAYLQWSGGESLAGAPHRQLAAHMLAALRRYSSALPPSVDSKDSNSPLGTYDQVKLRVGALKDSGVLPLVPSLPKLSNALPCNVPIAISQTCGDPDWFTSTFTTRHFPIRDLSGQLNLTNCLLLPVHTGVSNMQFDVYLSQLVHKKPKRSKAE
jgi:putative PLP-dependent aminotransferase (TIGR04422 family)